MTESRQGFLHSVNVGAVFCVIFFLHKHMSGVFRFISFDKTVSAVSSASALLHAFVVTGIMNSSAYTEEESWVPLVLLRDLLSSVRKPGF